MCGGHVIQKGAKGDGGVVGVVTLLVDMKEVGASVGLEPGWDEGRSETPLMVVGDIPFIQRDHRGMKGKNDSGGGEVCSTLSPEVLKLFWRGCPASQKHVESMLAAHLGDLSLKVWGGGHAVIPDKR